jgi:hypothetical protein
MSYIFINVVRCESCLAKNKNRCYHWRVGDEDSVLTFQAELQERMDEYTNSCGSCYKEIMAQSKIVYNPTEINRFGNKYNIDFDYNGEENDDMDIIFFNSLVNDELILRKLPTYGSLNERRNRLLQFLRTEQRLAGIHDAITRTTEGKEAALMLIKQAIPCIMHMENRVGEKVITMLLSVGAERFQKERRIASLDGYVERMQTIVRTRILGTRLRPKQWKFPTANDGKEVSAKGQHNYFVNFM